MFDRLRSKLGLGSGDELEDVSLSSARNVKRMAERDHQDALILISLLKREHEMNHYSRLVQSALQNGRKKEEASPQQQQEEQSPAAE